MPADPLRVELRACDFQSRCLTCGERAAFPGPQTDELGRCMMKWAARHIAPWLLGWNVVEYRDGAPHRTVAVHVEPPPPPGIYIVLREAGRRDPPA